jgi:hypothetical protein
MRVVVGPTVGYRLLGALAIATAAMLLAVHWRTYHRGQVFEPPGPEPFSSAKQLVSSTKPPLWLTVASVCLIGLMVLGAGLAAADLPALLIVTPLVVVLLAIATWLQARSERTSPAHVLRRTIRFMLRPK